MARQEAPSPYRAAIWAAYCSMMTWRRIFSVGVMLAAGAGITVALALYRQTPP